MNCKGCRARMDALVAGEVTGRAAEELRAHLGSCVGCARIERETRAMLSLLQGLGTCPTGLDMDHDSAEETARCLNVPVRTGTFEVFV